LEEYVVDGVQSVDDIIYGFHVCITEYVRITCVILFMGYFWLKEVGKIPKI
jgi:hypothetical protein